GIGQDFDFAMVTGAAAVKDDLFDALAESGLGGEGSEDFGAGGVGGELITIGRGLAAAGRGGEGDTGNVGDELNVDVRVGKSDAHAGALFGAADLLADAPMAAHGQSMFLFSSHENMRYGCRLLDGLAFLADDPFVGIAHAFALVRLGRVEAAE